MPAALNHTIVWARDAVGSAAWTAELLGLDPPTVFGPFQVVEAANGVSLDYHAIQDHEELWPQHYAFLVSEDEFTEIFGRITDRGIQHWADPGLNRPDEINRNDGGRGVYFRDPEGHLLEIITRPYGAG
jgi:catechol 2,3-dioxygenase-like lactoylglutathione lyase family enzyme